MQESDADLMRRANHGDQAAFAELVRRYQPALRRVALSRLRAAEVAEEIVQETFLAAYRSRHTYDQRFGFRTWLWTILLNLCRGHAGRQARGPKLVSLDADAGEQAEQIVTERDGRGDGTSSPLARLLARERRELLDNLLARLTPAQADAIRLRFFGQLKFQEIAAALECSPGAAKERVRSGLVRLSQFIREETADLPASTDRHVDDRDSISGEDPS
ncbi:MAG: sigma-70 family RNA polymerase sigma factor [Planctomycetia bacterium]|nr:sigma-70 family RNA polymerase sigma factor [Planctomycetia bacterium]